MRRTFSFNESRVLFILKVLPTLLPGIEKIISVAFDAYSHSLVSHVCKDNEIEMFKVSDSISIINRFRLDSAQYTWLQKGDLPFEISIKEKVQLDIFNEFDNNILLIRILNESDQLQDLFFIYFNQGLGSFGNMNSSKIFSTDNKAIIAHLVRNAIVAFFANMKEDQQLFSLIQATQESVLRQKEEYKVLLDQKNRKYSDGIIRLCESCLEEISAIYHKTYQFSDPALQKLSLFDGDFGYLRKITEEAARQAELLSESGSSAIIIEDYHISFVTGKDEKEVAKISLSENSEVPARYTKTLVLLNKLENAALSVKAGNKMITSMNIGAEFPTPITPPAISDALKKHRSKILHLFQEYPDRWEIIRSEFRPIQNILQVKRDSEQLSA